MKYCLALLNIEIKQEYEISWAFNEFTYGIFGEIRLCWSDVYSLEMLIQNNHGQLCQCLKKRPALAWHRALTGDLGSSIPLKPFTAPLPSPLTFSAFPPVFFLPLFPFSFFASPYSYLSSFSFLASPFFLIYYREAETRLIFVVVGDAFAKSREKYLYFCETLWIEGVWTVNCRSVFTINILLKLSPMGFPWSFSP